MKRYWKIGTLTLFIIVTLAGFFIKSIAAFSNHPEFVLQSSGGDDALQDKLVVKASYSESDSDFFNQLMITGKGSMYNKEFSLSTGNEVFLEPKIEDLRKKYKSYMRGKVESTENFNETDKSLAYATTDSEVNFADHTTARLDIDVLEKESGHRRAFQLDLPYEERVDFSNVIAVQLIDDDELKVVVHLSYYQPETERDEEDYHVYSIDMNEEKILEDDTVVTTEVDDGMDDLFFDVHIVEQANEEASRFLVFMNRTEKEVVGPDNVYDYEIEKSDFVSYDLKTGEEDTLPLPDELGEGRDLLPVHVSGNHLLLYEVQDKELTLYDYNLSQQQLEKEQVFDVPEDLPEDPLFKVQGDHVFIANPNQHDAVDTPITVYKLETADVLYEGTIESDDQLPNEYELQLLDLSIQ